MNEETKVALLKVAADLTVLVSSKTTLTSDDNKQERIAAIFKDCIKTVVNEYQELDGNK